MNKNYCCVRGLHESDLPALRDLMLADGEERVRRLLGFVPDVADLRRQTFGDPDFDAELSLAVFRERILVGCAVGVNRRWKAGREDTGFIKWIVVRPDVRRDGIGGMLLDAVQAKFAAMGMREIFFGGSAPWYLLPGVPADEEPLRKLLVSRGWDLTSKRINLYLDSETIAGAEPVTPTGVTITLVASGERGSILDFVETNFSVSWAIESEEVFRQPDAFMLKACDAAGDTIGFVAIGATNRNWLGPMGLIEAQQGRGVGKALLLTALAEVHKRGMERICIPWAAEGFYIHCLGPLQRLEFTKATRQL